MRTLSFILFSISTAFCAVAPSTVSEVTALLLQLPPQRVLREARDIVVSASSEFHQPKHKSESELERAKDHVAKAKAIIPKLRALIKPGASVFEFPGLLAHGDIGWSDLAKEYQLYMGVYLRDHEGQQPYDLRIRFDAKGVILKLEDSRWKN